MEVDLSMSFNSAQFKEDLMKDVNLDRRSLEMEPYPSPLVLAQLASAVYSDGGEGGLPPGWKILTTFSNRSFGNGYFGTVYCEPSLQQVVIAHRGTDNFGSLLTDLKGVVGNRYTSQMNSAVTFSDRIVRVLRQVRKKSGGSLQLSVTGHSLGGWLAQVTAFTLKYVEVRGDRFFKVQDPPHDGHVHAVTFDSPGCGDMLKKIIDDGYYRHRRTAFSDDLDITNYLAPPNRVNTFGSHVGTIHVVHFDVSHFSKSDNTLLTAATHPIRNFVDAFTCKREIREILDWPVSGTFGWEEYNQFYKRASREKGYIPAAEGEEHQQDTWEIQLRYKRKEMDNSCNLRVFSEKEMYLLKLWSLIKRGKLKMDRIDKFTNENNLQNDLFPKFTIDDKSSTLSCHTEQDLHTVIRHIKVLVRCFCAEFTEAMELQSKQIPEAGTLKYQMATQNYLDALPECHLHFDDTVGLVAFLESKEARIFQINTEDSQFEVARLRDLLGREAEKVEQAPTSDAKYLETLLSKDNQSFMNLKQIEHLEQTIDIESLYNSKFHEYLMVIDCASSEEMSQDCKSFLKRISNIVHKKIIYVLSPQSKHESFLTSLHTPDVVVPCNAVGLLDLTEQSQKDLFERKMLIVEGKKLSWADYVGMQNLSSFLPFINTNIDKQMFKNIVTDLQYTVPVKNSPSSDLHVHSFVVSSELSMTRVANIIREHTPGALLVIRGIDREELRTEGWKELLDAMGQDAEKRIYLTLGDSEEVFKQMCRQNPRATVFCFAVSAGRIYRTHLYREQLYMKRQFHQLIFFNLKDFGQRTNIDDALFVFQNETSKDALIALLPGGARDRFLNSENVKMAASAEKANDFLNENGNKPVHVVQRETDAFLWQRSRGTLDGLRPHVVTGSGVATTEKDLCAADLKAVIIAGEPGMGKSTSLVSMSRLLNESSKNWVIHIDLKHFKTPIDELPIELKNRCEHLLRINIAQDIRSIENWQHDLLKFCLHHHHSKNVYLIFDGFDELKSDDSKINTKNEVLKLLDYLIGETRAKVWVTTRLNERKFLENGLSTFAVTFKKIEERQQREYLVNFWRWHLLLETEDCGEAKLEECARDLYNKAKQNLGEDIQSFMGIPLQMRMLAEVFLQKVKECVISQQIKNTFEVENVFWLYAEFIKVKYDIYLTNKTRLSAASNANFLNSNVANFTHSYGMLALRTLFPDFAEKHCEKEDRDMRADELCRIGLVQSGGDGNENIEFIHRTLTEHFCAYQIIHWLSKKGLCHARVPALKLLLTEVLLKDSNKVIRLFINDFLLQQPTLDLARDYTALQSGKICNKPPHLLLNDMKKTGLQVAVVENNTGIIRLRIGGLGIEQKDLFDFIEARDALGCTTLHLAAWEGHMPVVRCLVENGADIHSADEFGWTALYITAWQGHMPVLQYLVEKGGDINSAGKDGCTALHRAAGEGHLSVVQYLVENGGDLNLADKDGRTALHRTAEEGHVLVMEYLAEKGGDINLADKEGCTPLHRAAGEGRMPLVQYLVEKGGDINFADKDGWTALQRAVEEGQMPVVQYLVEMGGNINLSDKDGWTALHKAAKLSHMPMVQYLIEKGGDINLADKDGWTTLHIAARLEYMPMVQHLVEKGVEINSTNKDLRTALHIAIMLGHMPMVQYFVEKGGDINTADIDGRTALHLAARLGHMPMVQHLTEMGGDINSADKDGCTTLHIAVRLGNMPIVQYIVEKGGDINLTDSDGRTALNLAASLEHVPMVQYLVEKDGWTTLYIAARLRHKSMVQYLVENGGDINSIDKNGWTALQRAVEEGYMPVVQYLAEMGGDINLADKDGWTALHKAVRLKHMPMVQYLIEKGGNINLANKDGRTALHLAVQQGYMPVVQHLVEKGADINSVNKEGRTVLHLAAWQGHMPVVQYLIDKGVDINSVNKEGRTALHLAAWQGHIPVVQYLLEKKGNIKSANKEGGIVLQLAAWQGHMPLVRYLVDKGVDVNSANKEGRTALHRASEEGHLSMVKYLIEKGGDINSADKDGWTALQRAATEGHMPVVQYLVENGGDTYLANKDGRTALSLAVMNGHSQVVQYLRSIEEVSKKPKPSGKPSRNMFCYPFKLRK